MTEITIGLGIALSLILSETLGVTAGGIIVPGYIANLMPQNFADQLSEEEIDALVAWLLDPNREE